MNKLKTYNYHYFFENLNIKFVKRVLDTVPVVNHPILYTDGSRMMNSVGDSFTVWYKDSFMLDMRLKLHDYNSVYQSELAATDEAINWCIDSPHDSFHLYTPQLVINLCTSSAYFHLTA